MRWINAGTLHWLWIQSLLRLRRPALIRLATTALGCARRATRPTRRRQIARYYESLSGRAAAHHPASPLATTAPGTLTRQYFAARAFLDAAPPLVTRGNAAFLDKFAVLSNPDALRQAAGQGLGMVIMGMHTGAPGISAALLAKLGLRVIILRDQQFARYRGTLHDEAFFLGAEPVFLDENNPASVNAALLKCAKALRQGAVIAFTGDAGHGARTRSINIFGRPLQVRTALIELAMRTGCPVTYALSHPQGPRLALDIGAPRLLGSDAELQNWLEEFAMIWEKYLAEHPECFSWQEAELLLTDTITPD